MEALSVRRRERKRGGCGEFGGCGFFEWLEGEVYTLFWLWWVDGGRLGIWS